MKTPRPKRIVKAAKMSMIQEYKIFARKSTFFLKNLKYDNIQISTHTYNIIYLELIYSYLVLI